MQDYEKPVWSFTRTNEDGTVDTKTFESTTWSQALQEFVNFIRGCGYVLAEDAIQISSDYDCEHWFGKWCSPVDEDDWKHPDDFYPPFEGTPAECAFEPAREIISLEDW